MRVFNPKFVLLLFLSLALAPVASAKKDSLETLAKNCRQLILSTSADKLYDLQKNLLKLDPISIPLQPNHHIEKVFKLVLDPKKPEEVSFVLRKASNQPWLIHYHEKGNRIGDPRWTIMVLGPDVARFFSMAMVSQNEILISGANLLNNRIDLFNEGLPPELQIPVKYLGTGKKAVVDEPYIRLFVNSKIAPLAEAGFQQIHDLYHLAWLYMPPQYVNLSQRQFHVLIQFADYVRKNHPKLAKNKKRFFKKLFFTAGVSLDSNGNITPMAAGMPKNEDPNLDIERSGWDRAVNLFILNGASPMEKLEFLLEDTNKGKPLKDLDLLMAFEKFRQRAPKEWFQGIGHVDGPTFEKTVRKRILFVQKRIKRILNGKDGSQ